jgi:hypothetical protein
MSHLAVRTLGIAASGLALSWLLLPGSSPLSNWLSGQPHITNVASAINLPTMLFALAGVPGVRPPANGTIIMVAVVQWLVYGFVLAWLWRKLWPNNSSKPTPLRGAA